MELLVHKYQPKKREDFIFHHNYLDVLDNFRSHSQILNMIVYGNYGAGKNTLCNYFINSYFNFDNQVYNTKMVDYEVNEKNIINILKSPYHYVIDVCDNKYNDKKLISDFIEEISKTINISNNSYKIIVIKGADNFSITTQNTITNLLELYTHSCRIIFICNSISKLSDNLISRCFSLHITNPNNDEIQKTLSKIVKEEDIKMTPTKIQKIVSKSEQNINDAIFMLEQYELSGVLDLNINSQFINNFADQIYSDIDIEDIRKSIYDLLLYDVSFDEFSLILIEKLGNQEQLNDEQRYKIMESISYYSFMINKGYRSIFHFESLIIFIINVIKNNDIKLIKEVI